MRWAAHWSVRVGSAVALFAAGLGLVVAATAKPLGYALIGAGVARGLEQLDRFREQEMLREADRQRDLDETRRLLLMVRMIGRTGNVEIAATLLNALVRHQGVDEAEALALIPTIANGVADNSPNMHWLDEQVARINAESRRR